MRFAIVINENFAKVGQAGVRSIIIFRENGTKVSYFIKNYREKNALLLLIIGSIAQKLFLKIGLIDLNPGALLAGDHSFTALTATNLLPTR